MHFLKQVMLRALAMISVFAMAACSSMGFSEVFESNAVAQSSGQVAQSVPKTTWAYGLPTVAEQFTDGGAGGEIIKVTSLKSEGEGTLRAALSQSGPRIIVFEVAGTIDLGGKNLVVREPHVTVAGQTAPSPGINIIRGGIIIGGHDVIVQHLRIRPGDLGEPPRSGRDIDAITTIAAHNVIVDHCTLSWATDENLSASGPRFTGDNLEEWRKGTSHNILFSNNLISEGLSNSTHAKGEHSKGSLIHDNVSNILIYMNIYASNMERSPLFKGGVQGSIVNNYIYNPGQRAIHYNLQGLEWSGVTPVLGRMDVIGNAMKGGPSTLANLPLIMIAGVGDLSLFMQDNYAIDRWGADIPTLGRYTTNGSQFKTATAAQFDWKDLTVLSPFQLEAHLLSNAGARPWDRDVNDVRVLADLAEGRGAIIDSQEEVGGYPAFNETNRTFDAANWNVGTMTPRSLELLDNGAGAKGT